MNVHVKLQPTLILYGISRELSVGCMNYFFYLFLREFMRVILLWCVAFVMKLIFDVSVESLHENLGEIPGILDPG